MKDAEILTALFAVLEARKGADPDLSYVARLHRLGVDAILKKVGEESAEFIIAAKGHRSDGGQEGQVIHEAADLLFHALVALSHLEIPPRAVLLELERRFAAKGSDD